MKKFALLPFLVVILIALTAMECEPEPIETCEQDEICTAKMVSACCTEEACVYKYNGKEYTEDQLDELANDLGCGGNAGIKSASSEDDLTGLKVQLLNLMKKAQKIE